MKLVYNKVQLKRAVNFIWKKNRYATQWSKNIEDLEEKVYNDMIKFAKEVNKKIKKGTNDWRFLSTGGYTILIYRDSDDELMAEILIDASVSRESEFTSIKL